MNWRGAKVLFLIAFVGLARCHQAGEQPSTLLIIRGTVSDSATSEPLPAYVSLLGNRDGVFAGPTGGFELRAHLNRSSDPVLSVRQIGYEVRTIPIAVRGDSIHELGRISLKPRPLQLDDLIVDSPGRRPR